MLLRITALILLSAGVFFLQRASEPIFEQNRKVRDWPAVETTVTARFANPSSRAAAAAGAGHRPRAGELPATKLVVEYRYKVGDVVHRKVQPSPRSEEWMPAGGKLVAEGEGSYTRMAHFDPAKPSELFLPKALGVADYRDIFIWAPVLALGFGALVLRKPGHSSVARTEPAGKGWHRLHPKYSIRHRASGAWGVAIVCNIAIGLAAYDYFTGEPRARSTLSNALVCAAMAPGLVTAGLAIYYSRLARRVGDARVWVDARRAAPGTRLAAKFELPVKRDVDLDSVVVSLVCVRTEFTGPRVRWAERVVWEQRFERSLGNRRRATGGGRIEFEQRFDVPPDAQPSVAGGVAGPWIEWEIRVEFRLDHAPDYRGKFPLVMELG